MGRPIGVKICVEVVPTLTTEQRFAPQAGVAPISHSDSKSVRRVTRLTLSNTACPVIDRVTSDSAERDTTRCSCCYDDIIVSSRCIFKMCQIFIRTHSSGGKHIIGGRYVSDIAPHLI